MPDLHRPAPGILIRGSHALGVIHIERHGFFLVDLLAGIERSDEMLGVEMLRRGDQHGVDGFIVEQVAVIEIGFGVGNDLLGVVQALGVDIGERNDLGIGTA